MSQRLTLVAILLAIPLIAFGVSEGIQAYTNVQLRAAIRQHVPDADPVKVAAATMEKFCEQASPKMERACDEQWWLTVMSRVALGTGMVGLMLLGSIWAAGRIARDNRTLLLRLFKPGLYVTGCVLIGLVIVHAFLAMAALYLGESALIHRVHVGIILAIGLGAAIGAFAISANTFSLVQTIRTTVIGKTLTRSDAPELWAKVDEIASRLGALHPDHIVVGLDPNFFVTEAEVVCLSGTCGGRTLYCSLPLMRLLSEPELQGIIGHELGHFKGLDTEFSRRFYPIYRGTIGALASLQSVGTGEDGAKAVALLPAIAIFGYFLDCFAAAENKIGRDRELIADKEGAAVSDQQTLATALVKVHAFAGVWERIQQAAVEALRAGQLYINVSKTYHAVVCEIAGPPALQGLSQVRLSHPTDSHPPLAVRLDNLGTTMETIQEEALTVTPTLAAVTLVPEVEKIEEAISVAYQSILAHRLGISLEQQQEQRAAASA
jgi:Zn-dependent protease with chaperone function